MAKALPTGPADDNAELSLTVRDDEPHVNAEILTSDTYVGLSGLGTLVTTPDERAVLCAPAADTELDILPTGEIYMSHVHLRRRLTMTFGPGAWALRPMSKPNIIGRTIMQPYALIVRGSFVAMSTGEADYHQDNPRESMATALESCKSNALTRACKDLGIALECWDREFTENFRALRCVRVKVNAREKNRDTGKWEDAVKKVWRVKTRRPFVGEFGIDVDTTGEQTDKKPEGTVARPAAAPAPTGKITKAQALRLQALMKQHGVSATTMKKMLTGAKIDARVLNDIPARAYDDVCAWVEAGGQ